MECFSKIHSNQFGYKKNLSSKHVSFLANETISYYRQNDSKLNLIFLDASKAFDKLWRDGLFFKLLNNIPDPIWRILYNYYQMSKIKIKYEDEISDLIIILKALSKEVFYLRTFSIFL